MKYYTFFLFLLFVTGCGDKNRYESVNRVVQARKLLNSGNYNAAIGVYEELLSENNHNDSLKFELASAYSGRGRVNLLTLYPLLKLQIFYRPLTSYGKRERIRNPYMPFLDNSDFFPIDNELRKRREEARQNGMSEEEIEKIDDEKSYKRQFLMNSIKFFWTIYEVSSYVSVIPVLTQYEREDAEYAIDLLNEIKDQSILKKTYIYKSIISSILLINYLKDGFPDVKISRPDQLLCVFNYSLVKKNLKKIKDKGHLIIHSLKKIKNREIQTSDLEKFIDIIEYLSIKEQIRYGINLPFIIDKLKSETCKR